MNETQKAGQYVEGVFKLQQYVQRVDIVHPFLEPYPANSVRVLGRRGDTWFELSDPVEFQADLVAYYNSAFILGRHQLLPFSTLINSTSKRRVEFGPIS